MQSIPQLSAEDDFGLPAHDPRPPPIIKIGPHNQTLSVDSVALLRCQAEGDLDPLIRWYRNGRPLLMTDTRLTKLDSGTLQISGKTLYYLVILSLTPGPIHEMVQEWSTTVDDRYKTEETGLWNIADIKYLIIEICL